MNSTCNSLASTVLSTLLFTLVPWQLGAQDKSDSPPDELIQEIEDIYASFIGDNLTHSTHPRFKNYGEATAEAEAVGRKLIQNGPSVLPALENAIRDVSLSSDTRRTLVRSLREMRGEDTENLLIKLSTEVSEVSHEALYALEWQAKKGDGLEITLSAEQLNGLSQVVLKGPMASAQLVTTTLRLFPQNALDLRIRPFIERYRRVILDTSTSEDGFLYEGDTLRAHYLGTCLDIFGSYGADVRVFLREALAGQGAEAEKWLGLALASTGDPAAAPMARAVADDKNESVEVRVHAIRAYVTAAGQTALPDLERWAQDRTIVKLRMHGREVTPIATEAKLKIRHLKHANILE